MIKIDLLNIPFIWYILLNNHMDILKLLQKILYTCTINTTYTKYKLNYSLSKLSNKVKAFSHTHKLPFIFSRKKNKWQMPEISSHENSSLWLCFYPLAIILRCTFANSSHCHTLSMPELLMLIL